MKNILFQVYILISINSPYCNPLKGWDKKYQNNAYIEYYITPKHVNYGWADNGVFQFKLKSRSIKVPFENRTYTCISKKDSLYELFYTKENVENLDFTKLLSNLKYISKDKKVLPERILVIMHCKEKVDSFTINTYPQIIYKNSIYKMDHQIWHHVVDLMPDEIKENWLNNLPKI